MRWSRSWPLELRLEPAAGPPVAVHRRHRRGRRRRARRRGQAAISPRPRWCSAAGGIWRLPATLIKRRGAAWPSPVRRAMRDVRRAARPPRLRARLRRSVPARRRRDAGAARSGRRDARSSRRPPPSAWRRRGSAGRCRRSRRSRCTASRSSCSARCCIPGARILALTSDGDGPASVARAARANGFGGSRLTVLEALGGAARAHPQRRAPTASRSTTSIRSTSSRSKSTASPDARILPLAPGLADELFEHDGQITKREIRARHAVGAGAAARRTAVGHRRRRRLGRHRMDAAPIRRCAPSPSRPTRSAPRASAATPRRSACPASRRRGRGARGAAPACPRRTRSSSAAAAAMPACSTRRSTRWPRRAAGRQRGDAGDGGGPARPSRQARRRARAHRGVARRAGRRDAWLAAGDAGHAMVVGEAMIVAGIGCRKGVAAADVLAAIDAALRRAWPVARPARPAGHRPIASATSRRCWQPAAALGLRARHRRRRRAAGGAAQARSRAPSCRSTATGAPSVAEAAALAAAGPRQPPARPAAGARRASPAPSRVGGGQP